MNIGFWKALKIAAGVSIGWTCGPGIVIGLYKGVKELFDLDVSV